MATPIRLETAKSAPFVNGRATVMIGPERANTSWRISRMVVSTNATSMARLMVYRNVETPSAVVASTYNGNQNVNETDLKILSGEKLLCIWTGGNDGSIATVVLSGEILNGIR
jgi:hypothetical protein